MIGAIGRLVTIWDIADTLNGLMAIPNLIGVLGLSGVIIKLTKEYFSKEKRQV
ncbi:MAG: alanine:cation symporter family protein [Clostridia bacterium]